MTHPLDSPVLSSLTGAHARLAERRGRGLATRLIRAVGAGIRARAEIPFLHAVATNPAIALYEQLGFRP
jgi:predicted GNAT family acetyltransferase